MKKAIVMVVVILATAISTNCQVRYGVIAGGNKSKVVINGNSPMFSNDHFKSYHAGVIADVGVAERVYIQPRLLYVRKGATLQSAAENGHYKLRMNYAELCANVVYKLPTTVGKFFAGAGISGSYGFNSSQETSAGKKSLYKASDSWKRFDAGLNFTAGLELKNGMFVSLNSQKGMLDVYKPSDASLKHRSLSLSIGYFL